MPENYHQNKIYDDPDPQNQHHTPSQKKTHTKLKKSASIKTLLLRVLIVIIVIAITYVTGLIRLSSSEKFLYLDSLDGNFINKTVAKISLIHDFAWKKSMILQGFPFTTTTIDRFSPIVIAHQQTTNFATNLVSYWESTKQLAQINNLYPEKIIFSFKKENSTDRIYQRMNFWSQDGQKYSAETNEQFGHVIAHYRNPSQTMPSNLLTIPAETIITNASTASQKINNLAHILLEFNNEDTTYDVTFITENKHVHRFYMNKRGLILSKEN